MPSESQAMPVTVKTVAAKAGVSATTVSRVLNGKVQAFSQATRERVLSVARELDYRPNQVAVSLRTRTTRTIALIVPDISDAYFHVLARGVEDAARAEGYHVILCNTDRNARKELNYLQLLLEKRVDGIIFAGGGVNGDEHLQGRDWQGAQVVAIGPHRLPVPAIDVPNREAIELAVRHLADQGCRRVACVGKNPSWLVSQERLDGYRTAVSAARLEGDPALELESDYSFEGGLAATASALRRGVRFDGLVAFNDYSAVGAMRALREARLAVPQDVAVVGCDDIAVAAMVNPPLSSVRLPIYLYGAVAMRMVLDLSAGREVAERVRFGCDIQVRESSTRGRGQAAR